MVAGEAAAVVVADEAATIVVSDGAALHVQLLAVEVGWSEKVMSTFAVLYGVDHFGSSVAV